MRISRLAAGALVSLLLVAGLATASDDLALVPRPERVRALSGRFVLASDTVLLADAAAATEAHALAARLERATGFTLEVATSRRRPRLCPARRVRPGCRPWIRLQMRRRPKRLGEEGYRLVVRPGGVKIRARTAAGIFYAGQTLRQLLPPEIFADTPPPVVADWSAPAVRIDDQPRFPWRGALVDVGRTFMPVDVMRRFLDALALHKLNRLHWHLTDDQGWRLEIPSLPTLVTIGAWRAETPVRLLPSGGLLNLFTGGFGGGMGDGLPTGGFYSQAEIRAVVLEAAARHITIVPEIDMPGHIQSAIAALPALGNLDVPVPVATTFGFHEHILNVEESTFATLEIILGEVMALFPGDFVHLGGDEVLLTEWQQSPAVQARIAALGLADERALLTWFVNRMATFVTAHGRRPIFWNDVLRPGLTPDAAIMAWFGFAPGIEAAQAGRDVVMTPLDWTYFDHAPALPLPAAEQALLDAVLSPGSTAPLFFTTDLAQAYAFEPVPDEMSPDEAAHVLGAQGMLWTEWIRSGDELERFAFPRLSALAEITWSPRDGKDFADFARRLATHRQRLDASGIEHFDGHAP
jgi:hexosaminidase